MSTEKKSRGKAQKPGIPFKKQTPKQRAVVALIGALGSYGYKEAKYTANKFMNSDSIRHMNMKLLASVIVFIDKYDIESRIRDINFKDSDVVKMKDVLTPENIKNINSDVFESKEIISDIDEYKYNADFIRYFIFALRVLKNNNISEDNTQEINLLTATEESP
jgi:hypothetical protein